MSKITLNKRQVGDVITSTDLNDDLNQFNGSNFTVASTNIREQGLDHLNFKRGVLSHPEAYRHNASADGIALTYRADFPGGTLTPRTHEIHRLSLNEQSLGEKINLNTHDYIYRLSVQGYFFWRSDDPNLGKGFQTIGNFNNGLQSILKFRYEAHVDNQIFFGDFDVLSRGISFVQGGTHLDRYGHARFMCTIAEKIDKDLFRSNSSLNTGNLPAFRQLDIIATIEYEFGGKVQTLFEFAIQEKPIAYIQKFRK